MEIKLKIIGFEDKNVILRTDSGHTIIWPREALPDDCAPEELLVFSIRPWNGKDEKKKTAEEILNEILNTEEDALV